MKIHQRGFTVIEVLVALAVVAIATTLALPQYGQFVARSRVLDAVAKLSDYRARMEQYFLDRRSYVDDLGNCGIAPVAAASSDSFAVSCAASASSYVFTAAGIPAKGMNGFAYTIDETGARGTLSLPKGWALSNDCWTYRPDGSCL